MTTTTKNSLVMAICFLLCMDSLSAQETTYSDEELSNLSLEELMNIPFISASREEESSFKTPLSAFVITQKEIELSGSNSIPEALRICPGVIVREVSNGTYDVSMRGGIDGIPTFGFNAINTSILVMVDNRPVFNYFQGGTYWQNLPIGITDVDRIEVVHGPVSSLYGPNAVSGVINIITKESGEDTYGSGTALFGPDTRMISARGGIKLNEKLAVEITGSLEHRKKFEDTYYDPTRGSYIPFDSVSFSTGNSTDRFPSPDESLDKQTANLNVYYQDGSVDLTFSGGFNSNHAIYPLDAGLSVTDYSNESFNVGLGGKVGNFSIEASYLRGVQGLTGDVEERFYNYENTNLYVDYNWQLSEKVSLRPALSYQSVFADDEEYTIEQGLSGTFNGKGRIDNFAPSLKVDYTPTENLRIILGGRSEFYNYPEDPVFSYQGIVNYSLNEDNILRFVTGKSFSGSFLSNTLLNNVNQLSAANGAVNVELTLNGNRNLDLLNNTLYELGYRGRFANSKVVLDVALFTQHFQDFNTNVIKTPSSFTFTPPFSLDIAQEIRFENLPLSVRQHGVTLALQANVLDSKLQLRPNFTIQKTRLFDYSPNYNDEGSYDQLRGALGLGTFDGSVNDTEDVDGEWTPSVFGGINAIYLPTSKLSFNVMSYYFSNHTSNSLAEKDSFNGEITEQAANAINEKLLINVSASYKLVENASIFVNGYNLTDRKSAEMFGTDRLGRSFVIGLRANFN